jgi:hypothetical protein
MPSVSDTTTLGTGGDGGPVNAIQTVVAPWGQAQVPPYDAFLSATSRVVRLRSHGHNKDRPFETETTRERSKAEHLKGVAPWNSVRSV